MAAMIDSEQPIAFALGGLAGNNAFGAGFLEAARVQELTPSMISCTSGQIFWVYTYLQCRDACTSLREHLAEEIAKVTATGNINVDLASVALWGRPGVFRPAYLEYTTDLVRNSLEAWQHILASGGKTFLLQAALQTLPGRVLVPLFPPAFFKQISDAFNASEIGIAFNSYNPLDGCEYVHLNPRARELLTQKSKRKHAYDKGQPSRHRERTTYDDITPETVRDGLWIYQYGFDQKRGCFLDGAYYRQIMLAELVYATDIFVARPISYRWIGPMPTSQIGIEDLKTEVGFNGTYAGERHQIALINRLVEGGDLSADKYHQITLHEIEIAQQRGFMDYIFEKLEVFDEAYGASMSALEKYIATSRG
ncbi:hypothetical protein EYB53_020395 [Candidatus Chloroploca sp. M-50]|uniref:Uncharacterized protein n=1 Tax=Candidatus Chloroploca mongolica TaxID=2528176 RepID=A0ABS4DF69_9CHLR|nr:hypothetical protein [Candidatus Chloroploca mongolica]MBP1468085.1 hypothetical protein [Candidatus Chloroploca mongolica]